MLLMFGGGSTNSDNMNRLCSVIASWQETLMHYERHSLENVCEMSVYTQDVPLTHVFRSVLFCSTKT